MILGRLSRKVVTLELGIKMQRADLFRPEYEDGINPGPSQETSGGNRQKLQHSVRLYR